MSKLTIGEFLATQRKLNGYTQQQVADMLGVSNRTLSSWEQGRTYPDILILPALAEIYGISVDDITRGMRDCEPSVTEAGKPDNSGSIDARNVHAANSVWLRGVSLASPVFTALAVIFAYYSVVWAVALCAVFAVLTAIAAVTAIIFFNRSALNRAGAYLPEKQGDGTSEKCWLAISLNTCRTLSVAGWAYLLPVLVCILLLCLGYTPNVRLKSVNPPAYSMLFPLIAGLGALAASVIYKNIAVKKYGDERQNLLQRRNRVLFLICLTAILPVLASVICVSEIRTYRHETDVYSAPSEEFIRAVQTVYIGEPLASLYGVEVGEVFFDIQAAHVGYEDYRNEDGYFHITGNLYCGNVSYYGGPLDYRTGACLYIYVRTEDGNYKKVLNVMCVSGIGEIFEEHYDLEGNVVGQYATIGCDLAIINEEFLSDFYIYNRELVVGNPTFIVTPFRPVIYNNNYYVKSDGNNKVLKYYVDCDYFPLVMPIACIVSTVSIVAGCAVYYIIRKRIY